MRVIILNNLHRSDPEYGSITAWLEKNVADGTYLVIGDNQKDRLNGSLFFQLDFVKDAAHFASYLYAAFPDLVLVGNVSKKKAVAAFEESDRSNPYHTHLYILAVCYGKMDGPTCLELNVMALEQHLRGK